MLVRLELPVNVIGEVFRSQNSKMSGEQRLYLPENAGFRRARPAEQQQSAQTILIECRLDLRMAQHGVDGRTEGQYRCEWEQKTAVSRPAGRGRASVGVRVSPR